MPRSIPGADATGVADSTAALQAWIQDPARAPADAWGDEPIAVDLPPGAKYRISAPIVITRTVHLRGNGCRWFSDAASGLTDMLIVRDTAPGTRVEGIRFLYALAAPSLEGNTRTAVKPECFNFQIRDCTIDGAGYGLVLDTQDNSKNLNWHFVSNVNIVNCRHRGHRTLGTDVSGGTWIGVRTLNTCNAFDSENHLGPAIASEESSANGNTYVGCLWEVSDVGLRIAPPGGVCASVFLGCYVEGADPIEWVGSYSDKTTVIGGALGRRHDVKGDRVGARMSRLTFYSVSDAGVPYTVRIPGDDQNSAMWIQGNDSPSETWLFKRRSSGASRDFVWQHYLNQGKDALGFHARDLGGGAWEVAAIVGT